MKVSITKFITDKIKRSLAIVQDGDTATRNIAKDKYVNWKGNIYTANQAIASGSTLSAASGGNLTACDDGALNKVGSDVSALNSNIAHHTKIAEGTRSTIETALVTFANNMQNEEIKRIWFSCTSESSPMLATEYIGTIEKHIGRLVIIVNGVSSTTNDLRGLYVNGNWNWESINSNIANKPDKKSVGLSANQSFTLTLESGHSYLITMMTATADSQIVQMISKVGSDVKKVVLSQGPYSSYFTESLTASAWTFTNGSYASYVNVVDF